MFYRTQFEYVAPHFRPDFTICKTGFQQIECRALKSIMAKIFFNKIVISTESKAFFKSRKIARVILLSLILFSTRNLS